MFVNCFKFKFQVSHSHMFQLPLIHAENTRHVWDVPGLNVRHVTNYPDKGVL
jgi:hypothetical protein